MLCSLVLLGLIEGCTLDQRVKINLVCIKVGTVDTSKLSYCSTS